MFTTRQKVFDRSSFQVFSEISKNIGDLSSLKNYKLNDLEEENVYS